MPIDDKKNEEEKRLIRNMKNGRINEFFFRVSRSSVAVHTKMIFKQHFWSAFIYLVLSLIQLECLTNNSSDCIRKYLQSQIGTSRSVCLLLSNVNVTEIEEDVIGNLLNLWPTQIRNLTSSLLVADESQGISKDFIWIGNDFANFNEIQHQKEFFEVETLQMNSLHMISLVELEMDEVKSFFELFFDIFGANVNMLVANEQQFLWYSPVRDKDSCLAKEKIVVRRILEPNQNGICEMKEYVSMAENSRCKIRIVGIHSPPYVYYDEEIGFYKGIEYLSIDAIVKKLGFEAEYTFFSNMTEYNQLIDPQGIFQRLSFG